MSCSFMKKMLGLCDHSTEQKMSGVEWARPDTVMALAPNLSIPGFQTSL